MMDRGLNSALKNLAQKFGIDLIYLFGSQAEKGKSYIEGERVTLEEFSDLDIAISFKKPPEHLIHVYGELFMEISEIFDPFHIDLVFIHEMNPLFQYEIIKGIRIYEEDESVAEDFEEMVMKKAADLAFKKRMMDRDIMEAIEDGYFEFEYKPAP